MVIHAIVGCCSTSKRNIEGKTGTKSSSAHCAAEFYAPWVTNMADSNGRCYEKQRKNDVIARGLYSQRSSCYASSAV